MGWNPRLHPRDSEGKFTETPDGDNFGAYGKWDPSTGQVKLKARKQGSRGARFGATAGGAVLGSNAGAILGVPLGPAGIGIGALAGGIYGGAGGRAHYNLRREVIKKKGGSSLKGKKVKR